ncbi:MFS transporter [Bdellovibrionota bacterium]
MRANIYKCYLFNFLSGLSFMGAVIVPFFKDWGGLDFTKIFILQSWFMFWAFVLEVPTGIVADRYGRKVSISLGAIAVAIGCLIYGAINNYYSFLFAEFLWALGVVLISGADQALLYDTLIELKEEKRATKCLARYEAAGTIGIVLGLPAGSLIAGSKILPYPEILPITFFLSAIPNLFMFFVALTIKEPKRAKSKERFLKAGIDGLKYIFQNKTLRAFALNAILVSAMTMFMFWFYQPLAGEAGVDIKFYGFIAAGFNLFATILLLNVEKIKQYIKLRNVILFTAVIPGLGYIVLAFSGNVIVVLLGILLVSGLRLFRRPILRAFMNRHIQSENRATVLSGVTMMGTFVLFLFYPIVGALADKSLPLTLVILGVITILFSIFARISAEHIAEGVEK